MTNYPRIFAYLTAAFTFGLIIYIFTNLFYPFAQRPDLIGSLSLLGFGLVYMSLNASLARRFIRKTNTDFNFPYALIPVLLAPTFVIVQLQEKFPVMANQIIFYLIITVGSVVGVYLGIKTGLKKREKFIEQRERNKEQDSIV